MLQRNQVYKCEKCGNIVEVLRAGGPKLKCCAEAMGLMAENTQEAAVEKHVPVIEKIEGGVKVKVGEVAHPMEEKHYIEWIELLAGNNIYRKYLNPGEAPEAVFYTTEENLSARAYCNLHGNWKG